MCFLHLILLCNMYIHIMSSTTIFILDPLYLFSFICLLCLLCLCTHPLAIFCSPPILIHAYLHNMICTVQNIMGFASVLEDEGILGLAGATVSHTTSFACHVASEITNTAFHVVVGTTDNVGKLLSGDDDNNCKSPHETGECILPLYERRKEEDKEPPFVFKLALDITDIMLGAISPMLSMNNNNIETNDTNYQLRNRSSCGATDFESITADTESLISLQFFDASSHLPDIDEENSVYFDAECTTTEDLCMSISSTESDTDSFTSSSSTTDNSWEEGKIDKIPESVELRQEDDTEEISTYYLSGVGKELLAIGGSTETTVESFNDILDKLVERSLSLSVVGEESNNNWQPDDHTKKLLKRYNSSSDTEEWNSMLERDVLKYTSSTTMLMTRGIVNMTPTYLKELLLDCERVNLFNKTSLGKENLYTFSNVSNGDARIVKNVMKIPIVGSLLETLSLTHSRCIEDGFIIVSQSVSETLDNPSSPQSSVSILRSIPNSNKTELITISQFASMPIPKFLLWKVGDIAAMDFFNNLRGICNESSILNDIKVEQALDDKPAEGYDEFLKFCSE